MMLNKNEIERYKRHLLLGEVGLKGQQKLKQSAILVIGSGGLGCPVLQYLTAAGIGKIGIVDHDVVDLSNLQRQVLFDEQSLGLNKALRAGALLQQLNSEIEFGLYPFKLQSSNALDIIKKYDLVIDCTDNFEARYLINDSCVLLNKVLVYGAIYKFEGQLSVFNFNNGPTYRCLFPDTPTRDSVSDCNEGGVLGVLPGIIGTMQAMEALKIILGIGEILSGKLLVYNGFSGETITYAVSKTEHQIYSEMFLTGYLPEYETVNCQVLFEPDEIESSDFEALLESDVLIVDVRENHELPKLSHTNVLCIPLSVLSDELSLLENREQLVLFCKSGVRSKKAAQLIANKYNTLKISHLKNGLESLSYEL